MKDRWSKFDSCCFCGKPSDHKVASFYVCQHCWSLVEDIAEAWFLEKIEENKRENEKHTRTNQV